MPQHMIDLEAEGNILSAMITQPSCIDEVAPHVSAADFTEKKFGELFDAMILLHQAGKPVGDPQALYRMLTDMGVSWPVRDLAQLVENHFSTTPVYHAEHIHKLARLRRLQLSLQNAAKRTEEPAANADAIVRDLYSSVLSIDSTELRVASAPVIGQRVIETIYDRDRQRGTMLGISVIDETIGFVCPGEMIVLAARPGIGKTAMAMQFAHANAMKGRRVLYVSLEMSADELVTRTLCSKAGVNLANLRAGCISDADRNVLTQARTELPEELLVHDPAFATMADIRGIVRLENRRSPLRMLVIDYLQLVEGDRTNRRTSRYEEITQISRKVKQLAKSERLPVLALSQLSRAGDAKPELIHLRESGAIEQDADIVMLLSRRESNATLDIAKHRAGETGEIDLNWHGIETRFDERIDCF